MVRWIELLEGDNQRLSMRSVCTYVVMTTLCAGLILCLLHDDGGTALGLAGILSSLMGIIYGIGKFVDGSVTKASMSPTPAVTVENVESVNVNQKPKLSRRKP